MKRHHPVHAMIVYVGFLDGRPNVQQDVDARVLTGYLSRSAARRAYADVRRARVVFDADWCKRGERGESKP